MEDKSIRDAVRERFAATIKQSSSCGCSGKTRPEKKYIEKASKLAGYTEEEMNVVPDGANLGLGCGNPVAFSAIKEGDVVLDLGSGAGVDCFIAAGIVGKKGRVIGVDMTPEMVEKARQNIKKSDFQNVEFRLGEIENLPVESSSVDVIISNCAINLSPDKPRVFQEAFRVLKPGGTMLVSDTVLLEDLPDNVHDSIDAYVRCVAGAMRKEDYLNAIKEAGFRNVKIAGENGFPLELVAEQPVVKDLINRLKMPVDEVRSILGTVVSVKISARKAFR